MRHLSPYAPLAAALALAAAGPAWAGAQAQGVATPPAQPVDPAMPTAPAAPGDPMDQTNVQPRNPAAGTPSTPAGKSPETATSNGATPGMAGSDMAGSDMAATIRPGETRVISLRSDGTMPVTASGADADARTLLTGEVRSKLGQATDGYTLTVENATKGTISFNVQVAVDSSGKFVDVGQQTIDAIAKQSYQLPAQVTAVRLGSLSTTQPVDASLAAAAEAPAPADATASN